jgi:putative FmdB family regulatory protein
MPTYEYRCNACHREFEYQQRMSDPDLVKCEACGADQLEKLISRTAFQLKGGGWYKDLYSSNPKEAMKSSVDKSAPAKTADASSSSSGSSDSSSSSSSTPSSSGSGSSGSGSSSSGGSTSGGGGSSSSSSAASGS